MRALLSLLYGLAAYAAFQLVLVYFIGFSAGLVVPKGVDDGVAAAWPRALGTDLALLLLFGVQHSVMARRGFKRWWIRVVPPVVERSTFVVASCLVLALMMWLWVPIAAPVVWRVERPAGVALLWGVFALGWLVTGVSTFLLDHFELFGLRQVFSQMTGRPLAPPGFRTPLFYRHVRHPLYLGFLLGFWSVPVMTAGHLLLAAGLSLYILVGIAFEERDLLDLFGERYRTYRGQVGMLLPRWRTTRRAIGGDADNAG